MLGTSVSTIIYKYWTDPYLRLYVGVGNICIYDCMHVSDTSVSTIIYRCREHLYLRLYIGIGHIRIYDYT